MSSHFSSFAIRLNNYINYIKAANPSLSSEEYLHRAIELISRTPEITHIDFNYPSHVDSSTNTESLKKILVERNLKTNSVALRFNEIPIFSEGAFSHQDKKVRQAAIEHTQNAIVIAKKLGSNLITVWLSQEGYDSNFQIDYKQAYLNLVATLQVVLKNNPSINISIEYKPNEPRIFSLIPNIHSTLLLLDDLKSKNAGITIDFSHSLYSTETPSLAASLVFLKSRLFGVHLNDGFGKKDDGLPVASRNLFETLEFLSILKQNNYQGVIYFDTFTSPYLDPVDETKHNIEAVLLLDRKCSELDLTKPINMYTIFTKVLNQ